MFACIKYMHIQYMYIFTIHVFVLCALHFLCHKISKNQDINDDFPIIKKNNLTMSFIIGCFHMFYYVNKIH